MNIRSFVNSVRYFFPVRLLSIHLKRNHILLLFWILMFGAITNNFGDYLGITTLFLAPEYLGEVNFWSFFILGLLIGSFIVAYNIAGYIANGYQIPFVVTLSSPLGKYSFNNFIIPAVFIGLYIFQSVHFQVKHEFIGFWTSLFNMVGFLFGIVFFLFFAFSYFFSANKDIFRFFGTSKEKMLKIPFSRSFKSMIDRDMEWKLMHMPGETEPQHRVDYYFNFFFQIRKARRIHHYPRAIIRTVLRKHYVNASLYALFMILLVLITGLFSDNQYFVIPAAGSITLLFSVLLMLSSVMYSVMRGWATTFLIVLLLVINYVSKYSGFDYANTAYGVSYKAVDNIEIDSLKPGNPILYRSDVNKTIETLEKWKKKNTDTANPKQKPYMVFVNVRGGGMKAAIWTYYCLGYADSLLNKKLMPKVQLMTGASGGMFGAAYIRELYLQYQQKKIPAYFNDTLMSALAQDILNPVAFDLVTKDWFWRFQTFEYAGQRYYKDRAYSFEKCFNQNTNSVLDKKLNDYAIPESQAQIPMMMLTPTVTNDGRKLIISPLDVSYMLPGENLKLWGYPLAAVEFRRKYRRYNADSLRFVSALRMNATFPYIAPIVSLPGKPTIHVMDAAVNDIYGATVSLQFLYTFREWIAQNTAGVIFIFVTERKQPRDYEHKSLADDIAEPVGNVYLNMYNLQNNMSEQMAQYVTTLFGGQAHFVQFYLSYKDKDISLSWHLSKREKQAIMQAIHNPENRFAMDKLGQILGEKIVY